MKPITVAVSFGFEKLNGTDSSKMVRVMQCANDVCIKFTHRTHNINPKETKECHQGGRVPGRLRECDRITTELKMLRIVLTLPAGRQ